MFVLLRKLYPSSACCYLLCTFSYVFPCMISSVPVCGYKMPAEVAKGSGGGSYEQQIYNFLPTWASLKVQAQVFLFFYTCEMFNNCSYLIGCCKFLNELLCIKCILGTLIHIQHLVTMSFIIIYCKSLLTDKCRWLGGVHYAICYPFYGILELDQLFKLISQDLRLQGSLYCIL